MFRHARQRFPDSCRWALPASTTSPSWIGNGPALVRPAGRRVSVVLLDRDLGIAQAGAWTPEEDAWYVGEKQDLFAALAERLPRGFISLGRGPQCRLRAPVLGGLGLDVHDAGLSPLVTSAR